MKRNLYVIYDRVAEESGAVQEITNDGVAFRWFRQTMAQNQQDSFFDETDFTLLHLGEIDKTTNIITPLPPREVYINLRLIDEEKENESI